MRIRESGITREHRTVTDATNLICNYFYIDKFGVTPEQTKEFSRKRPYLSMGKLKLLDHEAFIFNGNQKNKLI